MLQVVFVPGILGCSMVRADGFILWPPIGQAIPMDVATRVAGLLDPTTRPGEIVRKIDDLLFGAPEYGPILDALAARPGVALHQFVYDWRRDIRDEAGELAFLVASAAEAGDVIILAHSMGGLVSRYMLESGDPAEPWLGSVKQLIAVATPHLGAPLALFRVLGIDGIAPVVFPGWAVGALASKPEQYPAAHQLLPAASQSCVMLPNGDGVSVQAAFPGLAKPGMDAQAGREATLGQFRKPAGMLYRVAFGNGHMDTAIGVTVDALGHPHHLPGDGDGTVPVWSSQSTAPDGFFDDSVGFRADHVGILQNADATSQLFEWINESLIVS